MASPGWLAQEAKPPTSQAPTAASPSPGAPPGPPTPSVASATVAGGSAIDSKQESAQGKFAPPSAFLIPATSFTYGAPPAANRSSGSTQQPSTASVMVPNSVVSAVPRPQLLGPSASCTPLFSYNNSHTGVGFPNSQHSQFSTNASAGLIQEPGAVSSASTDNTSAMPTTTVSASSLTQVTKLTPSASSIPLPPAVPAAAKTLGPPGIATASVQSSSSLVVPSVAMDSSSSALPRPVVPAAPVPSNPAAQQQVYPLYTSMPSIGASPQAPWLQPPQIGGLPRPVFLPYPPIYPGPFPLPVPGISVPSVPLPVADSQPPGVTPLGNAGGTSTSMIPAGVQIGTAMHKDIPAPGTDDNKDISEVGCKDLTSSTDQVDAWSAHRTDTGAVYYYNAITGDSTYEKPAGFMGEPDKVTAQPTPVSWEKLAGTDWALVSTNDGKRYYYNNKTKISSWQIPTEVTELRKKQEVDNLKDHSVSVLTSDASGEKGSSGLSAPAISTGGRDSTTLRTSAPPGSSSALDLVKKKLQESGAPITSSPGASLVGPSSLEINGSRAAEASVKGLQSENSNDKPKETNRDGNISDSSSDSEDEDTGPTVEERIFQFKEMLKERGVAPFSKWEKELPKIVFDPRFKSIPSYAERRSLFEHYVRTRAEEERKEKRAALKAAIEGFKQLLEEAKEDIDHNTNYQSFRKKWGHDPRFEALDRKERELLLNERILPLKRAAEEKAQAARAAAASGFKSMLREKGDITTSSRWSRVKDSLRDDPRYKGVKHEEREILFNDYIAELKAAADEAEQVTKAKREEQDKLKERERELRKRKEREEHEMERVRLKVRRKEAIASYQALLVETIKDPQASWTESKTKLEKDPQGRATNPDLDQSDLEKLFREHIKLLHERCVHEFRALLGEVITAETAARETEDGKTVLNSWSTAKHHIKSDPRYTKMLRKDREALWRRHVEEIQRKEILALEQKQEKHDEGRNRSSANPGRISTASGAVRDRR